MSAPIRLFIGNLPAKFVENDLRGAFSSFGEITALDIKNKSAGDSNKKLFAFITLLASNHSIETCIQHFTTADFHGNTLYVTRARESFLERLQREREQAQRKEKEKNENFNIVTTPKPLNINLRSPKRKFDTTNEVKENSYEKKSKKKAEKEIHKSIPESKIGDSLYNPTKTDFDYQNLENDNKKQNSDKKRLESMKQKRREFNEKKMIIKTGLIDIDKAPNKKVIFSDDINDKTTSHHNGHLNIESNTTKTNLFDEGDDSDNEVNFEIKKQFEGKKGQKILDLQSRYKSDKRFVLDERFIEDDKSDQESNEKDVNKCVAIGEGDEKYKQLNILQEVLGVPIKMKENLESNKQTKTTLGMLRFDPTQPEHAKFLAPVVKKKEQSKKLKRSKDVSTEEEIQKDSRELEKIEVSKEQFYMVATDTLKESLEQPNSFSVRSLFAKESNADLDVDVPEENYAQNPIPGAKEKRVRNPLDPGEKNPFVYDSSESENEEERGVKNESTSQISGQQHIWREKLFFSETDDRLKDGLLFFTQINEIKTNKDRRELKSVMKKRVYNMERKNQMFQKKIGGRKKTNKKFFRKRV